MNKVLPLFLVLTVFLFAACDSSVRFGISQKYQMAEGERQGPLDGRIVSKYESVINVDTLNLPLNKFIYTTGYKVYIGVSFSVRSQELLNLYSSKPAYRVIDQQTTDQGVMFTFAKSGEFFYSYLFDAPDDQLTYLLTLEADSATVQSKFNSQFLSTKVAK